jgi:hypothetical protein
MLIKESPIISDALNIFRSEVLGIGFRYDENEKVKGGNNSLVQIEREGKDILWIEVRDVQDYAYEIRSAHPEDIARFMIQRLTGISLASGGPDGQSYAQLDSITEFNNPSGLRVLVGFCTQVVEDWGGDKTITTYERALPEYFIDLTGLKTVVERQSDPQNPVRFIQRPKIVILRWEGPDSLYEQRMRRFINTIVPFIHVTAA